MQWPAQMQSRAFRNHHSGGRRNSRGQSRKEMAMRLRFQPRYQRLKMKHRRNYSSSRTSNTWTGSSGVIPTLDNPTNRSLSLSARHMANRTVIGTWPFCRKTLTLPCIFWGCGNRIAMALLLTTYEEAILSKLLRVPWSIGNAKRVSQRGVGQPKQLRSEDQFTQENASAPRCDHSIRAMEGGITHGSRPRTDTRDRGDLGERLCLDHKQCYDTRHDEPGIARAPRTRGPWRLSWWQLSHARGDASAVRSGPAAAPSPIEVKPRLEQWSI